MAMPMTIWSSPNHTHSTTMMTLTAAPPPAPARNPSVVEPLWYAATKPT